MFKLVKGYILVSLLGWTSGSPVTCGLNQYTLKVPKKPVSCIDCLSCPPGFGTFPQCGAFLRKNVEVTCQKCARGVSYSPSYDHTSCEPCTICVKDQVVIKNCTATSNTVCGKCKPGHYRSFVYSCEKCSECCEGTGDNQVEEQCLKQGLPRNKACRYTGRTCQKLVEPTQAGASRSSNHQHQQTIHVTWFVVTIAVVVVLFVIIILLVIKLRPPQPLCFKTEMTTSRQTSWANLDHSDNERLASNFDVHKDLDGYS